MVCIVSDRVSTSIIVLDLPESLFFPQKYHDFCLEAHEVREARICFGEKAFFVARESQMQRIRESNVVVQLSVQQAPIGAHRSHREALEVALKFVKSAKPKTVSLCSMQGTVCTEGQWCACYTTRSHLQLPP